MTARLGAVGRRGHPPFFGGSDRELDRVGPDRPGPDGSGVADVGLHAPDELDERTARVVITVTNLSHRLPDADGEDANERSGYLMLDKAQGPVLLPTGN